MSRKLVMEEFEGVCGSAAQKTIEEIQVDQILDIIRPSVLLL